MPPTPATDASARWGEAALLELVEALLAHAGPLRHSAFHGETHWMRVALTGRRLLPHVPGADPFLVFLFAVLHDQRRETEGRDPGHGPRASELARSLNDDLLRLEPARLETLARAIHDHNGGPPSPDPTVGLCFDADRLNLWRIGKVPDPALLSTGRGRLAEEIERGRLLQGEPVSWETVARAYAELGMPRG